MEAGESDTWRQERVSVHTTRQGTCLVLLSKASQVRVCVRCPQGVGRPYHRSCPYHRSLAGSSACRTPTCMPFSTSALPTYRSLRPQHVSLSCGQRSFRATVARRSRNPAELQCEPRVGILQHGYEYAPLNTACWPDWLVTHVNTVLLPQNVLGTRVVAFDQAVEVAPHLLLEPESRSEPPENLLDLSVIRGSVTQKQIRGFERIFGEKHATMLFGFDIKPRNRETFTLKHCYPVCCSCSTRDRA